MIREITLGQYYPGNTILHRLDPRIKLLGTLVYVVCLFISKNLFIYALAIATLIILIAISKVPFSYMIKGLKPIIFILLLSVLFNLFLTQGDEIFHIWRLSVTKQGVRQAVLMAVRLICLILGASLMTFTTTPNELTDGLESGLGFLKVIRIPVHELAMMMSIALRFIPILTEELDKIIKAQMARGADLESGNIFRRAKAMMPLLVPLFISAFRRATDLASAMEARCYHGGKGRTRMHPLKFIARDYIALIIISIYLAGNICLLIFL